MSAEHGRPDSFQNLLAGNARRPSHAAKQLQGGDGLAHRFAQVQDQPWQNRVSNMYIGINIHPAHYLVCFFFFFQKKKNTHSASLAAARFLTAARNRLSRSVVTPRISLMVDLYATRSSTLRLPWST